MASGVAPQRIFSKGEAPSIIEFCYPFSYKTSAIGPVVICDVNSWPFKAVKPWFLRFVQTPTKCQL